jgi:hypothetical protein
MIDHYLVTVIKLLLVEIRTFQIKMVLKIFIAKKLW